MSRSHMPPVPPAGRSKKGPSGSSGREAASAEQDTSKREGPPENLAEQGGQGNINQNTYQQRHQQNG